MRLATATAAAVSVVLAALPGMAPAAPPRADANSALVILGVRTVRPDPRTGIDVEPSVERALPEAGGLIFVPWRGNPGAHVLIEDQAQFKRPLPNSGTVSPDARVFRVKAGPLAFDVAIDSNAPAAKRFDVLRLDPTCKGDFRNAPCIGIHHVGGFGAGIVTQRESLQYEFTANPVDLMVGNRKLSLRLQCKYREERPLPGKEPSRVMEMNLSGAAMGNCRFGDAVHRVMSPDVSGRMIGNDKGKIVTVDGIPDLKDWFWLYVDLDKGQSVKGFYGYPYLVDGKLWDITISDAGDQVSAKEFAGPAGKLHIDHPSWEASLASETNVLYLKGGAEPVPAPVGRYRILYYGEWGKPAGGSTLNQIGMGRNRPGLPKEPVLEIVAGKTADVTIGSPLQFAVVPQVQGQSVHFVLRVTDVAGRYVGLTVDNNGTLGDWGICDEAGKQVGVVKMAWGNQAWEGTWKALPGMKGTFSISVPGGLCSIPLEAKKTTFVLGGGK